MDFKNYKYEIIIGSVLGFMFIMLLTNILSWSPKKSGIFNNISFEMVRPKSEFRNEFSLNDREVDRKFINPFVKKEISNKHVDQAKPLAANQPKAVPKLKKNAGSEKDKSKDAVKKHGIDVTIIPADRKKGLTESDQNINTYQPILTSTERRNTAGNIGNKANNNETTDKDTNKETTKTAADFKDLETNPTVEKANQLFEAYKNQEISSADYFAVIKGMLESNNSQAQSLGVYLCYNTPNLETFTLVTINLDHFTAEVKTYADGFLFGFNHQARLSYLGQALQSPEIKVVLKAGEVIMQGLQKVKSGENINYVGRDGRGNNNVNSTQFFNFLLPIAEGLKNSQNQTVASVGQSIIQEIGTTQSN